MINRFLILVHTILSKMFQHVFPQVQLRDESAEDFENENIPELLYLNISLQVGKTVYHISLIILMTRKTCLKMPELVAQLSMIVSLRLMRIL